MAARRTPTRPAADTAPLAATVAQLARIYGCSTKHIDEQLRRGAPRKGPQGFDLAAWGDWWREQGRFRRLGGRGLDDAEGAADWTARRERAQALLAENKLADQLAMYCRREDVERAAARTFTVFRLLLENLPSRCAALVPAAQAAAVRAAVTDTVHSTLQSTRTALGRWSAQDDQGHSTPIHDVLGAFLDGLERLPERLGAVVQSTRQRERVIKAAGMCVAELSGAARRALETETGQET